MRIITLTKIAASAILCWAAIACQSKDNSSSDEISHISLAPEKIIDANQLIDSVELIPLETPDSILLTGDQLSSHIKFDQGLFFILDRHNNGVYVFDRQGHFVRQIGKNGQAPNEYLAPRALILQPEDHTVIIIDETASKLLYYGYDGAFKKIEELPRDYVGALIFDAAMTGNKDIAISQPIFNKQSQINLIGGSEHQDLITTVPYTPFYSNNLCIPYPTPQGIAIDEDGDLLFPKCFRDTIFAISDTTVRPKYVVEELQKPLPLEELENKTLDDNNNQLKIEFELDDMGYSNGFRSITAVGHYIFLKKFYVKGQNIGAAFYVIDTQKKQGGYLPVNSFLSTYQANEIYGATDEGVISLTPAHKLLGSIDNENGGLGSFSVTDEARAKIEALHLQVGDNPVIILVHLKK